MTAESDDAAGPADRATWLRKAGFFREVIGYAEAVELLTDARLHVNMVAVLDSLGVTSGLLREVAAASLLSLNGEEHKRCRALVAGRFTPRAVEHIRPGAMETAHELINGFASTGRCDLVDEFAKPYVRRGTCQYVGFPEAEVDAHWEALEVLASPPEHFGERERGQQLGVIEYARSLLEARGRQPRDDVLTLVADEVKRGSLPELVGIGIVVTLFSAGHEPTIKQLGIVVEELSRRPDLWDAVATGELPPARVVEAVLRFRSTNQGVMRRVDESFDYRGARFDEGSVILINSGAANHDPRRFAEPDRLDVHADNAAHLAFGFGAHHCLGAALARVQLQEAIRALAERLTCPEVLSSTESTGALIGPWSLTLSFSGRDPTHRPS